MKLTIEQLNMARGIKTVNNGEPDDLLIVCASFEPRTLFVTEKLSEDYRTQHAIVYVNHEMLKGLPGECTKPHLYRLIELLARRADRVSVVEGSLLDAVRQLTVLRSALLDDAESSGSYSALTIDCTTFNREALLTTVLLVRTVHPNACCRVMYASPETHGRWLSRGYRTVRNVMGLSGVNLPSRPTILAILSGFEPERTQRLIEEHEPAKVLLGLGDPPTSKEFLDRNRNEHKLVLARQDVEEFRFPVSEIHECKEKLGEVLETYVGNSNVVVAPMSTKFSTLAALLAVEDNPEIQISYCVPGEYNVHDYSSGVSALLSEQLPVR